MYIKVIIFNTNNLNVIKMFTRIKPLKKVSKLENKQGKISDYLSLRQSLTSNTFLNTIGTLNTGSNVS